VRAKLFQAVALCAPEIICLALAEIIAEKVRACYQRDKARDRSPADANHGAGCRSSSVKSMRAPNLSNSALRKLQR